jgi:hypothetical protein
MLLKRNNLLLSFFFVSLYSVALETFLSRYFAVTNWAEYGYWIISIVMAGFAISGIILSLFESFFKKHSQILLSTIPAALLAFTVVGIYCVSVNPFNPLECQNEVAWKNQLVNIFKYYAALFPIFFLLGVYISLIYIRHYRDIRKIYAVNLIGSAIGSVAMLGGMYLVHVFYLPAIIFPLLLVPVFFGVVDQTVKMKRIIISAGLVMFVIAEVYIVFFNTSNFPFYKSITTVLSIEGSTVVKKKSLPEGYFMVLDDMTEFNNTDLSNNYGLLKMGPPPRSFGVYRDGRRISSLVNEIPTDYSYLNGALDSFPYDIRKNSKVLLAGTNGGFRIFERQQLGASEILALEPDPTLFDLVGQDVLAKNKISVDGKALSFKQITPYNYLLSNGKEKFDVIDISSDFLSSGDNNKYSYTVDAVKLYLSALSTGGVLSIPVNITEFTVHSSKLIETVRRALEETGAKYPAMNIMIYRSNWTARVVASNKPFSEADLGSLKKFCVERSFDASYYPGINPETAVIWNDLPAISFDEVTRDNSGKATDAIMHDSLVILGKDGKSFFEKNFFNLSPSTVDRPSFYSVLRASRLGQILQKRSILPQEEIGYLVNIFVLAQAVFLAIVILLLPLLRIRSFGGDKRRIPKIMIYFACLGLGFLFIEMALIERFSVFLNSATTSFSVVLAGMLVFSGLGSWFSSRFVDKAGKGIRFAVFLIAVSVAAYILFLFPMIQALSGLPLVVKGIVTLIVIAPVSFALGMPYPLGLSTMKEHTGSLLPWAYAINGAFSVIATPVASIVSVSNGFAALFVVSIILYLLAFVFFPAERKSR